MGLAGDLGYEMVRPNAARRAVQRVFATRTGAWAIARMLPRLDDLVGWLSRGRLSAPELLAGLPVVELTTTGRKSGQPRTTHLISVPIGDTLSLLGTNFGQAATPAWVLNLEAEPRAELTFKRRTATVTARPASEEEFETVMRAAAGVYPGYPKYRQRITGRQLRIFILEPA